jgi:hypothetical protein
LDESSTSVQSLAAGQTRIDVFTYEISDAAGATATASLSVTVTGTDDAPTLTANSLTIGSSNSVVLAASDVAAADVDTPTARLVFTVGDVRHGRFELSASPGAAITSFTQSQLASGAVRFIHDGGNVAPSYSVSVSDGSQSIGPFAAAITFKDNNVSIPDTTATAAPIVVEAEESPVLRQEGASQPAQPRSSVPALGVMPEAQTKGQLAEDQGPVASTTAAGGSGVRHFAGWLAGSPIRAVSKSDHLVALEPELYALQLTNVSPKLEAQDRRVTFRIQPQEVDSLADAQEQDIKVWENSVRFSAMALSAGAVWWATRASGLMVSLLAGAGVWRQIDPLPVLGRDDEDEDEQEWAESDYDEDSEIDELAAERVLGEDWKRDRLEA